MIDISHESLIRRWGTLKEWVEKEEQWGERYRRVEDRKWIHGALLVDQELQLALNAQREGRWNEAWAERYVTQRGCSHVTYTDVVAFLEESKQLAESKSPDYLTVVISRIISDAEQTHLFNLADNK